MLETAVVIDVAGEPLGWHLPPGRTAASLPDSRALWEVLWTERERLLGVAHSHPGRGEPSPSWEDLTTFAAVEAGLGRRLVWWITTRSAVAAFQWGGPGDYDYVLCADDQGAEGAPWLVRLRELSYEQARGALIRAALNT